MQNLRRYIQNVEHSSTVKQLGVFLETTKKIYIYVSMSIQGSTRQDGAIYKLKMENPDLSCSPGR